MSLTPFDYQIEALDGLRAGFRAGKRRGLLCMLMRAGKTFVAMNMMRGAAERGKRSLFLCDRRLLAEQAVEVALDEGLDAGLLMAGRGTNRSAPCQFASKQTLTSRIARGTIDLPDFDLIVTDEAHRGEGETWQALKARWPRAWQVGLTATPCLGNGGGMGAYYDFLVQPITPSRLREMGRIVPVRAFEPHYPDLTGVKTGKDGDYAPRALAKAMTRAGMVGDRVGWWKRLAEGRPSIYFSCDIAHALAIRDEFNCEGVPAEIICAETPDDERRDIKRRLKNGSLMAVVNYDVLAEGIDWPFVSCIGLVRPTKRLRRYLQNAGRGMGADEGKKDMILIDHAGCVRYHGFPDRDIVWPLDPSDNVDKMNRNSANLRPPFRCVQCFALIVGTNRCPECGHVHKAKQMPKDYGIAGGTLVEATRDEISPEDMATLRGRFWCSCIGTAIKRMTKAGVAAKMFSGKFGLPPWEAGVKPLPPNRGDWQRPAVEVFPGFRRGQ